MRHVLILFITFVIISCSFTDKDTAEARKMALHWHNREIIFPPEPQSKIMGKDTVCPDLMSKKYKIFTYIDTAGCTACNLGLQDWKQMIRETDSLTKDVAFLFFAHVKDYADLENNIRVNDFNYPVFYDLQGECNKLNHLPNHVFYQTFLLDENNKVLLLGRPRPNSKIWKLYKKIIAI